MDIQGIRDYLSRSADGGPWLIRGVLAVFAVWMALSACEAGAQTITTFGVPTDQLMDASPDGWDLAVVIEAPIPGPEDGETAGTVDSWNYYASDQRVVTEYRVTPLLVKFEGGVYSVAGIGETREPQTPGVQENVDFNLQDGTDQMSVAEETVTYHMGFISQRPGFADNDAGGIIPFSEGTGVGMFAMDTLPETELQIDDPLTSGHASGPGGRDYQFNFVIQWGDDQVDRDPDLDLMPTTWEESYGLNPADPSDAMDDGDEDGLPALLEFLTVLRPNEPDRDGDGASDGAELAVFAVSPEQETSPPDLGGATPTGAAIAIVDATTRTVRITAVFHGMSSEVTASHLHGPAEPGTDADVLIPLTVETGAGGTQGSVDGEGVLSEDEFAAFLDGRTYLNVHTVNNSEGEIRGQVPAGVIRTDPKNEDTDGDRLLDGVEDPTLPYDPANPETQPGTHPLLADTDGDGYKDGSEISLGTDPTDSNSRPAELPDLPEFLREDWDLGDGTPDSWDLTVILTTPIEPPEGINESQGVVEYLNYYHSESRTPGDHPVAPVLVKYDEASGEYTVAGVGEFHHAEEAGAQAKIPFVVADGTNEFDLGEPGITWHAAVQQNHPAFANNQNGSVIPFAGAGGQGMFGYDSGPDEVLSEGLLLTSGHASDPGGRNYGFNIGIRWGAGGLFEITAIDRAADGRVDLSWTSSPGQFFHVEKSLSLTRQSWSPIREEVSAAPDPATETSAMVDTDTENRSAYYRVVRIPPPPLFSEDFESGATGWSTISHGLEGTEWEIGPPEDPPGPHGGANVAATDLDGDFVDGLFDPDTASGIGLRSPAIDLAGRDRARLRFWHFVEVNDGQSGGRLRFLDADDLLPIEIPGDPAQFLYSESTATWTEVSVRLPAEILAAGRVIFEWEWLSADDGDPDNNGAGWFIDDVAIE